MAAAPLPRTYPTYALWCRACGTALQTPTRHRGQPLTNADGQVPKVGSTVVDSMFGEGIARGTVSLSKGDGVNGVQIDRRRRQQLNAGKPPSRGIENLKLARLHPGWQQRVHALGEV